MNDDIHGLSGAYAVDAVDADERARFEEHLAVCPECRREVDGLRSAAAHLATITEVAPPASLKAAVLRDIASVRPLPPRTRGDEPRPPAQAPQAVAAPERGPAPEPGPAPEAARPVADLTERRAGRAPGRRLTGWLAGAAAAVLIAVGGLVWHPWTGPAQPPVQSATEQVLQAADATRYAQRLDGATATIVRSASLGRAVIVADNMPAAPAGHVYEIWLQHKDGSMVRAGLMPEGSQKQVSMVLDGDASAAVGAGITVEPDGGSVTPTTKPLVLFSFA